MRLYFSILILSLFSSCKTEYRETIDTYLNGKIAEEYIYPDKNVKCTYTIINYYKNGQIAFEGTVKDSMFVGVKRCYYENGNVKEVDSLTRPCELTNCDCDGIISKYYSNAKLQQSFEFKNGMANGFVHLYDNDSSGRLGIIYTYKDDKKNGTYKNFYNSGELYRCGTYQNDTLVGQVYYFEPNGDTMKINYTWKGKEDFPSKKWLHNGEIFYGTYMDKTYKKALYRWTDKAGKEVRKEIVSPKTGGEWISSDGNWITPN